MLDSGSRDWGLKCGCCGGVGGDIAAMAAWKEVAKSSISEMKGFPYSSRGGDEMRNCGVSNNAFCRALSWIPSY